jgi:hypothetical protein
MALLMQPPLNFSLLHTIPGARSVGRPKLRWEDGVDQDMRILGFKNWKKVALNRDEGHSFLRRPQPTRGY